MKEGEYSLSQVYFIRLGLLSQLSDDIGGDKTYCDKKMLLNIQ